MLNNNMHLAILSCLAKDRKNPLYIEMGHLFNDVSSVSERSNVEGFNIAIHDLKIAGLITVSRDRVVDITPHGKVYLLRLNEKLMERTNGQSRPSEKA